MPAPAGGRRQSTCGRRWGAVREEYANLIKRVFHADLLRSKSPSLTQAKAAERLAMYPRACSDLHHGRASCGLVTLLLYLTDLSADPASFLGALCDGIDKIRGSPSQNAEIIHLWREAVSYRTPLPVVKRFRGRGVCPSCSIPLYCEGQPFCMDCGQKLQWYSARGAS